MNFHIKGDTVSDPTPFEPVQPPPPSAPLQTGLSDTAAGALAYFTFIPALIFLLVEPYNKSPFVRFHAWQSILLSIAAFVISLVLGICLGVALIFLPYSMHYMLWRLIDLAWLIVWLLCVVNAFNGKRYKLPVIGALAEKQAGV
jgi:uncharacterized membrane protein